ncbi:MAG: secretin N-terminal domain-containing protein, partial [Candidatus Omnitrophota bacterium]|nr:secretin N-terminal domain-containing protein [Candidatus Omnitrophota bacterium]
MKTIRFALAIIVTIFMSVPYGFGAADTYTKPDSGAGKISMDFQDANLKTVLKVFSQQSGLNFIASQNIQDRTVTVYFDNVTVGDALNYIMNANSLTYEQDPGTNIFIVKETGKPAVDTVTKIYELKYAQLSNISKSDTGTDSKKDNGIISIIESILTKNGKVLADKRSNSLIINDVPSQFSIIEELLTRIDTRTPQVMIKLEVLETTTKAVENLGINWGGTSGTFGTYTGPISNTIFPMNNRLGRNNSSGEGIATTGTISMSGATATLYALLNNSDTKILARPQIMAMNNETAKIELSSKEKNAVVQTSTTSGSSVVSTGNTYQ